MKPWGLDPLKYCHYYKKHGCSHVDGFLCNVSTCSTSEEYNKDLLRTQKIKKIYDRTNKKIII